MEPRAPVALHQRETLAPLLEQQPQLPRAPLLEQRLQLPLLHPRPPDLANHSSNQVPEAEPQEPPPLLLLLPLLLGGVAQRVAVGCDCDAHVEPYGAHRHCCAQNGAMQGR